MCTENQTKKENMDKKTMQYTIHVHSCLSICECEKGVEGHKSDTEREGERERVLCLRKYLITQDHIYDIIFQKRHWREKSFQKKRGHFAHIGNEIKICSQNKCHHHLSNVCENSFCMFHSNWLISDYHSLVWAFC